MWEALVTAAWIAAAPAAGAWAGTWTFDLCHEDRRGDHDKDTFCREGRDRLIVSATGRSLDITRCPADPWGERMARIEPGGTLAFRTPDGLDMRLTLGEDRAHFRGRFTGLGGHAGRVWGRRVAGCG